MSTPYEAFLPEVLPYAPDCPEIVAVNAIRNACIEFCEESNWLLYEHPEITTLAGVGSYPLIVPTGTMSARIYEGWCGNLQLKPVSEEVLKRVYVYDWREMEGGAQFVTMLNPDEAIIVPKPLIPNVAPLKLIIALKPTRDSVDVDDRIYQRWAEQIGWGARGRLLEIPNQSFYDPATAMKYKAMFTTAIGQAAVERNRGLTRAPVRARPPRFF